MTMSWEWFFFFTTKFSDDKIFHCTASFSSKKSIVQVGSEELYIYSNTVE